MKNILVDYTPFEVSPQQIKESFAKNGKLVVSGILQTCDVVNQNKRKYPKNILMREAKKYAGTFIKERRALGELDHPDSSVVNLSNTSHNIVEMHWNGNNLIGTIEVLCDRPGAKGTPAGNILKSLFDNNIKLGISSRGIGSVKELYEEDEDGVVEVQDDFELVAFDFVSNPSTHGAFMGKLHESKNLNSEQQIYSNIENIIMDIITTKI